MQIVPPPDFVIAYRYKNERSVALKIRQNPFFGRDSAPERLERGHPSSTRQGPTFGARHASPQKSSQIYAYVKGSEVGHEGTVVGLH